MTNLAVNIRAKLKDLGMTQRELSEKANISTVMIHKLLSGKSNTTAKILDIARALQCDPDWLLNGAVSELLDANNPIPAEAYVTTRMVPIISYQQAANWPAAIENKGLDSQENDESDSEITEWEPAPTTLGPNAFWMRVVGDSMTSPSGVSIPEGFLVLVDPEVTAQGGNLIVAKQSATQEVTCKKLVSDAGRKYLKPLNFDYNIVSFEEGWEIVGVVLEAKIRF